VLIYATSADLATWTGAAPPTTAAALLRMASMLVRTATVCAVYDVDETGLPADAATADAMRDATCAQAATWAALDIDPNLGIAADNGAVAAKELGTAKIQYATYEIHAKARAAAASALCPEAIAILVDADLIASPQVIG